VEGGSAEPQKKKATKSAKVVTAISLLEKLSAKPTDEELKKQSEELLAGLELTPFERAIAQKLNVAGGLIDESQFVLEAFTSKKLLSYAIKSEPPLLSSADLILISRDPKMKASHAAVAKALKGIREQNNSVVDDSVLNAVRASLQDGEDKALAAWIENLVLPLGVVVPSEFGAAMLSSLYGKIDPKKGASSNLKELLEQVITWMTQPQNLSTLDRAITDAAGLGAGSYATIIHETRKMPFKVGTPRYLLVMSLCRKRERKTVTFLARSGIFKDFTLDGIGLLADNPESFSLISENESALAAVKDECRRRLKAEELPRVHYWLLKYPNVRQWLTDSLIIQRLRPQDDFLAQLVFDEGRVAGSLQATEQAKFEIDSLRVTLNAAEAAIKNDKFDREALEERVAVAENRLRGMASNAQGAKDDQIRQAQIDSVKVLIEFMNSIEVSSSADAGMRSALEATRAKLKSLGVAWRYEIGSLVPFVEQDHLASNLSNGAKVQILTPCYYLVNTQTQIALVKARVLPQEN
jgi:hypothetical protein